MPKSLESLREFEKDIVIGYYRLNYDKPVSVDVMRLSMVYLWIFDEFNDNKDYKGMSISGLNNTICKCISDDIDISLHTVYGRNIIQSSNTKNNNPSENNNYYHWQFKILNTSFKPHKQPNYIIGIASKEYIYSFIGSHAQKCKTKIKQKNEKETDDGIQQTSYGSVAFNRKYHILDMYLDFNKGELSFVLNNTSKDIAFNDIDLTQNYRIIVSLSGIGSEIQLISYHHSQLYSYSNLLINQYNKNTNAALDYIGYIASIPITPFIDNVMKYYLDLIKIYPSMNDLHNEYIRCLIIKNEYDLAYDYILKHNINKITIPYNASVAGFYFYQTNKYKKAIAMYHLLENDETFIPQKLCIAIAECYTNLQPPNHLKSIKYYNLYLNQYENDKYESKEDVDFRDTVIYAKGLIYYEDLRDYQHALDTFLLLKENGIKTRNLEGIIEYCYEVIGDWDNALIWCQKYQIKHPNDPKVFTTMASIYGRGKKDDIKADEHYKKALEMDNNSVYVHSQYGDFLSITKKEKDYERAKNEYEIALKNASDDQERDTMIEKIAILYADHMHDYETALTYFIQLNESESSRDQFNYSIGFCYKQLKQYKNALIYYEKYQLENNDVADAAMHIAILYEQAKEVYNDYEEKADEWYQKALKIDIKKTSYNVHYNYGDFLINSKEKDYKTAIKYFQKASEITDENEQKAKCIKTIAQCYQKLKQFDDAVIFYKKYQEIHTDKTDGIMQIARMYEEENDYNLAEKYYEVALDIDDGGKSYTTNVGYACFLCNAKKELIKSLKYFEITLEIATTKHEKAEAVANIGVVCAKLSEIPKAEEYYKRVMDEEKENYLIPYKYANFLVSFAKDFDRAQEFYEIALENVGNDDEHLRSEIIDNLASCYDHISNYDRAMKYSQLYLNKYGDDPDAIILTACLSKCAGNLIEADKQFNIGLNLKRGEKHFMIHKHYAIFLINNLKKYDQALRFCESALKYAINNDQTAKIYTCIGLIWEKLGDVKKAKEYTQKSVDYNPNDSDALNNLGYYYLFRKDYHESFKYLSKTLELFPDNDLTSGNLAICLYEMGKYDESIPYFLKSLSKKADIKHPDVGPKCMEYYAQILYKKNKYEQSIKWGLKLIETNQFKNNNDDGKYNNKRDEIYYLLSRNYSKLKEFENALKYLEKAKNCNPNRKIYENQIKILKNIKVPDLADIDKDLNNKNHL